MTVALDSVEYVSERDVVVVQSKEEVREKERERSRLQPSSRRRAHRKMFSGLTSQVSNWMGKKPENGSEATPEVPKPTSPDVETGADLEKKNNTR